MEKTSEKILFEGTWLRFKELKFRSHEGAQIVWECIERKNVTRNIVIIPTLKPSLRYILIKQFRPAVNNFVLGFPAGIAYSNDIEAEALKELKEETGYCGTITEISPVLAYNSALSNETVQIVLTNVDEENPQNLAPRQSLEPEEQIEVLLVPQNNIREFICEEQNKGTAIGSSLWYLFGVR